MDLTIASIILFGCFWAIGLLVKRRIEEASYWRCWYRFKAWAQLNEGKVNESIINQELAHTVYVLDGDWLQFHRDLKRIEYDKKTSIYNE